MKRYALFLLTLVLCGNMFAFEDQTEFYKEVTTVMADNASYDGAKIFLSGDVTIENRLGRAVAEEAILQKEEDIRCKIDFPFIELGGDVDVILTDGRHLKCDRVALDLAALTSLFEGENQVFYQDDRGEILADRALIDYEKGENGKLTPKKVTLMGHVQMKETTDEGARFALADRVIVYPQMEKMILECREDRQVLFFDEQKKIQLAAKTVEAKKNQTTGKESIKGFGDVKFVLAQEEFNKIKESFSLS